jgi:hypothetical protein
VFGSAAVFSAMQASRKAHEQLDLATAQHSNERFEHTFETAEAADNRLIELVRTELHGKSEPLPDVKAILSGPPGHAPTMTFAAVTPSLQSDVPTCVGGSNLRSRLSLSDRHVPLRTGVMTPMAR